MKKNKDPRNLTPANNDKLPVVGRVKTRDSEGQVWWHVTMIGDDLTVMTAEQARLVAGDLYAAAGDVENLAASNQSAR